MVMWRALWETERQTVYVLRKKRRETGGTTGCVLLFVRRVCLLVSEEVYVCVIVSFQGGDCGPPSCKLLESGQMVNLYSTFGKTTTKQQGSVFL